MPRSFFFRLVFCVLLPLSAHMEAKGSRPLPQSAKISFATAGALGLAGGAGLAYTLYRSEQLRKQRIASLKKIIAAANERDGAKNPLVQRLIAGATQQASDAGALIEQGRGNKEWLTAATDLEQIYEKARKNRIWQKIAGGTLGVAGLMTALGVGFTLYDEHKADKEDDAHAARDQRVRIREAALGHYETLQKTAILLEVVRHDTKHLEDLELLLLSIEMILILHR